MANRYGTAVVFSLEKNIYTLSAHITFGAAGAPTLDTSNSKGFCNIAQKTVTFTGTTANSSATVTSVSSFAGLYVGMVVSGTNIQVGSTIVSMNAGAGTMVISLTATGTNTGLTATGGYTLQFGTQANTRLDTYPKILSFQPSWDLSGLQGGASTAPSAPAAPELFITANNISVAGSASISFMTGNRVSAAASVLTMNSYTPAGTNDGGTPPIFTGTPAVLTGSIATTNTLTFKQVNPASGEGLRLLCVMGNSTAI